jgi:transcriptional regulator with XRE-family HTH domain
MEIGTKIKKARENKGFSQEKMSNILGISQSKYCRFESNRSVLDWEKIPVLAKALDMEISDIIPNCTNVFYFSNLDNQSGYIEKIVNKGDDNLRILVELIEKINSEKEIFFLKLIAEKDEIINILKKNKIDS